MRIPVNRRADALFFLHTARIDQRRNDQEKKEGQQFELVHYVVHYADGQELTVPIVSEVDVDDYRVEEPRALPGAQLAWTRPYEGTTYHAAVYSKQWNNPHPNIEIQSIDVLPVDNPRGSVAVLAITAAGCRVVASRSQTRGQWPTVGWSAHAVGSCRLTAGPTGRARGNANSGKPLDGARTPLAAAV